MAESGDAKDTMAATEPSSASKLLLVRSVVLAVVLACVLASPLLQPVIDIVWTTLLRSKIFSLSFFETIWTGLAYYEIERRCLREVVDPQSDSERYDLRPGTKLYKNGTVRYTHAKHRIPELFKFLTPLLALDLTMIKKYSGVPLNRILRSGNYPAQTAIGDSLTRLQIRETYLVPSLHRFTWSSPLQIERALPMEAPTPRALVLTLIGSLLIYDFLFGLAHLALHKMPLVSSWHMTHHAHQEMQPQVTNKLDITERLILILSANWALNLLHAHPLTRIAFVPLFLSMLIQNHAGRALQYSYDRILPEGWAIGPKHHAMHHRKGNVYYAPYFRWFDAVLQKLEGGHTRSYTVLQARCRWLRLGQLLLQSRLEAAEIAFAVIEFCALQQHALALLAGAQKDAGQRRRLRSKPLLLLRVSSAYAE